MRIQYRLYKNVWISTAPVLPCVWSRKEGGHVVRARVMVEATGRKREIFKVLPDADAVAALQWLEQERARVRNGSDQAPKQQVRFSEFATLLFEQKVKAGDIKSAAGRRKWGTVLKRLVLDFGDFYVDKMQSADVDRWRQEQAERVHAGEIAPTTVNGWLAILRVIMKAAKRTYKLAHYALDGVTDLDESEHDTYTDEEPNSLEPAEVQPYVALFREWYPQHFAMLYLGLITGLRPSTLRPMRRRGPECDVHWDDLKISVRRSHTFGEEVMRTTKQGRKYSIDLPKEAMDVLRWHVRTQLETEEQQESDLLFPALDGGFRARAILLKPMAAVAAELDLRKRITPRALRRTFNDLARAAKVNDLVTRSISGHLTDKMQRHYSTVSSSEQRDALAKVIRLFDVPRGEHEGEHRAPGGEQTKTG